MFLPSFLVSREARWEIPSREFNVLASLHMGGLSKHKDQEDHCGQYMRLFFIDYRKKIKTKNWCILLAVWGGNGDKDNAGTQQPQWCGPFCSAAPPATAKALHSLLYIFNLHKRHPGLSTTHWWDLLVKGKTGQTGTWEICSQQCTMPWRMLFPNCKTIPKLFINMCDGCLDNLLCNRCTARRSYSSDATPFLPSFSQQMKVLQYFVLS